MDPIHLDGSSTSAPYDQIEIDDDEEDQLDSDIDEQPQVSRAPDGEDLEPDPDDEEVRESGHAPSTTPTTNGKRKHPRKTGVRVLGHTLLPATRLENILRADGNAPSPDSVTSSLLTMVLQERAVQCRKRRSLLCQLQRYVPPSPDVAIPTLGRRVLSAGGVYQTFRQSRPSALER